MSANATVKPTTAPPTHKLAILAIILLSYVMIVLDTSIVITGLPKIHSELGFTDEGLSWVTNAYLLTFGGFLLLGARAGDILGRRRMFVIGLTIFVVSSIFIGFAQSSEWLVIARAVQGVGSAILAPSTLALLQVNFPDGPERTRAISYYASAAGVSASFGLVLGGILADWTSWRVGFFINLPIGVGLIIAAFRYVDETERHSAAFDLSGALTSTAGMILLVFGIVHSAATGWGDPTNLKVLLAGIVLMAVFVAIESRARQPIMPLRLFVSKERSGAYAVRVLFLGANVGFFFFSTQFMQGVLNLTPTEAGLAFLPAMVVSFITALQAPQLIARFGSGTVVAFTMLLGLVGMIWLAQASSGSTYWTGLAIPMLLIGIGQGGALGPLTTSGIAGVSPEDAGAASGLVNTAHQLGSSLGLSVLVAASAAGSAALSGPELLAHRTDNAMTAGAVLVGLALIVALVTIPRDVKPRGGIVEVARERTRSA